MTRYTAVLFCTAFFLAGCARSGAVVITPLNSYTRKDILNKAGEYCQKYGMIPAEVRADTELWKRLVDDVIREYIYTDLRLLKAVEINAAGEPEVSEEEIRSKYEHLLFSQKEYFSEKKDSVTAAIRYPRDTILYYPEGLKWVKSFVVPFESEIRGRAAIFLSEGKTEDYEKLVNAAEADMAPLLQNLRLRLRGEAGFDEAAAEFGGGEEALLYDEDHGIFAAQLTALRAMQKAGDIAEYNIYQGHVFMVFLRKPDYIEVPYGEARETLEASIRNAKTVIQQDRQLRRFFDEAIADGSVKIRTGGLYR